jgi:hypothetical protein
MTIKTLFLVHLQELRRHVATSDVDSGFQDASSLSLLKVYVCVAAAPLPQKVSDFLGALEIRKMGICIFLFHCSNNRFSIAKIG